MRLNFLTFNPIDRDRGLFASVVLIKSPDKYSRGLAHQCISCRNECPGQQQCKSDKRSGAHGTPAPLIAPHL